MIGCNFVRFKSFLIGWRIWLVDKSDWSTILIGRWTNEKPIPDCLPLRSFRISRWRFSHADLSIILSTSTFPKIFSTLDGDIPFVSWWTRISFLIARSVSSFSSSFVSSYFQIHAIQDCCYPKIMTHWMARFWMVRIRAWAFARLSTAMAKKTFSNV